MPRDTDQTAIDVEVRKLSEIADRPSLHGLAWTLRNPALWPKDFVWDYRNCTTCAMGLAAQLWVVNRPKTGKNAWYSWAAKEFAIPYTDAIGLFNEVRSPWKLSRPFASRTMSDVTPEHVAAAIERYLAENPDAT